MLKERPWTLSPSSFWNSRNTSTGSPTIPGLSVLQDALQGANPMCLANTCSPSPTSRIAIRRRPATGKKFAAQHPWNGSHAKPSFDCPETHGICFWHQRTSYPWLARAHRTPVLSIRVVQCGIAPALSAASPTNSIGCIRMGDVQITCCDRRWYDPLTHRRRCHTNP